MVAICTYMVVAATLGQTSSVTYATRYATGTEFPSRVAVSPGGTLYVTDPPLKQVVEYDATGTVLATYAVSQEPVGIAVHADGRVFVSRADGKVGVYSSAFVFQSLLNASPMTMGAPNDMEFDATAMELYVVDTEDAQVLVFEESSPGAWTLARAWGTDGGGLGEFVSPLAIAVDPVREHVIVTDADNFRIQVFDTAGTVLFKFGYRMLYTATQEVGWVVRAQGVALDDCGNIYLADAMMGTVRVFDPAGGELSATHAPAIGYGTGAGQLRTPSDLTIDGAGNLYVANTSNASVEVYDVVCTVGTLAATTPATDEVRTSRSRKGSRLGIRLPDNPFDLVGAIATGLYSGGFDVNFDRKVNLADLELVVRHFGAGTVQDFLSYDGGPLGAASGTYDAPHVIGIANACGRCHSVDGAPGGMLTAAGQENLCLSCHNPAGIAMGKPIGAGTTGGSHPWGVAADDADPGPAAGSLVSLHLDNGDVRCGTCHNQHEAFRGTCQIGGIQPPPPLPHIGRCIDGPFVGKLCQADYQCDNLYVRTGGDKIELCGECHKEYDEWLHAGHSEEYADPWFHYDWSMGNNWLCTGPGTPYAYCTGEGVGTAASTAAAVCTGAGTPLACCTGAGTGPTCTVSNAGCSGPGTPFACCTGVGTGNCANNLSAAACTGPGTPMACCTGAGTGSCSSREACRQCHSGEGYIDFSRDFQDGTVATSTHRGTFRVADCLVCHATHGMAQDDELLRIYDTVRLPTGQVLSGLGAGATCVACHNGRSVPPVPNTPGVSSPHYLNGGAMLEGINAVLTFPTGPGAVTYAVSNSNHTTNAGIFCTTCHMAPGPSSGPGAGKVGGHTFNLKVHDPADPDYGFENVDNTCNSAGCHTGVTSINRTAYGDYDGDGTIEGVQDETRGLLARLKDALYGAGASRLLVNGVTGAATTEPEICTAAGVPLACCTGVRTGPTCVDPDAEPANPYWTTTRCTGGTRAGLPCRTGTGTAPFDCPGGGTCTAAVPSGNTLATVEDGIWNWEYVDNSGDLGVKNTGYAIGILQIAYKGVTGVAVPGAAYRYSPAP
ncbi:MAG: SMP-30/gluconolactonase/LRE family protein [Planctomycetes bacterium]|nr:SMP-30/gluconolactonase/LRE family protein [Planctomycetota bacterium]